MQLLKKSTKPKKPKKEKAPDVQVHVALCARCARHVLHILSVCRQQEFKELNVILYCTVHKSSVLDCPSFAYDCIALFRKASSRTALTVSLRGLRFGSLAMRSSTTTSRAPHFSMEAAVPATALYSRVKFRARALLLVLRPVLIYCTTIYILVQSIRSSCSYSTYEYFN